MLSSGYYQYTNLNIVQYLIKKKKKSEGYRSGQHWLVISDYYIEQKERMDTILLHSHLNINF